MNKFTNLKLQKKWQQFGNVDIDFHDRLTILTGANGSGKTTLLNILARHFDWPSSSLATPRKNVATRLFEWGLGWLADDSNVLGEISYSNGSSIKITTPNIGSAQYSLELDGRQRVDGFFIPSHRSVFRYEQIDTLPTRSTFNKQDAFSKVAGSLKNRYLGGGDRSSNYYMKEVLISWNIFGHGNPDMPGREDLLKNFQDFESVLRVVLPESLGFQQLEIRNFEIVLICKTGEFLLDAASGGVSTIVDLAWQIHMFATEKRETFSVLIDEVENHLHPTMQRRILHDLLKAFPMVTFIVSTHSPLIVSSVKDSKVYALRYRDGEVFSDQLDLIHKARTATEVLDEVLGVSFTMPIWVEDSLNQITEKYLSKKNISKDDLLMMRNELKEQGLERLMPEAIYKVADKHD